MIALKHYTNYIDKTCATHLQFYDLDEIRNTSLMQLYLYIQLTYCTEICQQLRVL